MRQHRLERAEQRGQRILLLQPDRLIFEGEDEMGGERGPDGVTHLRAQRFAEIDPLDPRADRRRQRHHLDRHKMLPQPRAAVGGSISLFSR